jgi:hypothetical protein
LSTFLDAYKANLNELPVAVRFDIAWGQEDKWHREWHRDIPQFIHMLKARGIGYSIIYDAGRVNGQLPMPDGSPPPKQTSRIGRQPSMKTRRRW